MIERLKLETALDEVNNAVAAAPDEVGGISLEAVGNGGVVIYLAPAANEGKWKALVAAKYRYPDRVRFERVGRSATELQARVDEISADIPRLNAEGIEATAVGVDVTKARVVLSLAEDNQAQKDELAKRYPDAGVKIARAGRDSDNRLNSGGQWKAGLRIIRPGASCTAGFTFQNPSSGTRFIATAGHCHDGTTNGTGSVWYHNANPAAGSPTLVGNYFFGNTDVAMISSPGYMLTNLEILQGGLAGGNDPGIVNEGRGARVTRRSVAYAGNTYICKSGQTTGYTCGYYVESRQMLTTTDIAIVDAPECAGDSGGPVTTAESMPHSDDWTVAATGILKGGDHTVNADGSCQTPGTWFGFTKLANIEATTGLTLVTGSTAVPIGDAYPVSKCLDVPGGSHTSGQNLVQYTCSQNLQPWELFEVRPKYGHYGFVPTHTMDGTGEQCFTVEFANPNNYSNIEQYKPCVYPPPWNQRFRMPWTSAYAWDFQIQAADPSNRCIDVIGANPNNNAPIQLYDCVAGGTNAWNQRWHHY